MDKLEIMNIQGIACYEKEGTVYLNTEACARGLGFTEIKDGKEYVMWRRVDGFLEKFGFGTSAERPEYIPENIFYRLAMKAKNAVAEAFQAKIADEVIPSIRRTGQYSIAPQQPRLMLPEGVSLSGLARLISITRRAMVDAGSTPLEVCGMIKETYQAVGFPVPSVFPKQMPGQISLFDPPALA